MNIEGYPEASSLLVEVKVPRYRTCDSEARLSCHYSLEGETLYSLKWYKGDSQFYQYIPGNPQPKTYFKVPGVNVDIHKMPRRIELPPAA
ncbi:hypothetical protein HAZT_HAZT007321 [Hyalella azteca]|uniref:Ig-like domain-containing protein n=1 Tax=Hyalella azteca TaxID=294128 RepID=A0A6A0GTW7_HYAAZ|nr:hypothetical protein HAZT_HAZT007321 [Hyalella azteca]